jgi:hypothetical protein
MSVLFSKKYRRVLLSMLIILMIFWFARFARSLYEKVEWVFSSFHQRNSGQSVLLSTTKGSKETDWPGFPDSSQIAQTLEIADSLPLQVFIPLSDAVKDIELSGWEDQWFAQAIFNSSRWGLLTEPKIDIIYHCMPSL